MVYIKISKGLDIPIKGKPEGSVKKFVDDKNSSFSSFSKQIALDLHSFEEIKFKLLVQPNDLVKIGQPLAEDKLCQGRMVCSPAGGVVKEIRRGPKRSLMSIVIEVANQEEYYGLDPLNIDQASQEAIINQLKLGGLFAHIRSRPFNVLSNPNKLPRSIFVKAIESAPFVPPAELQVAGFEKEFQEGLHALSKITSGAVHLVYRHNTLCRAFTDAQYVQKHPAEGPHPIANQSLHVEILDPINSAEDIVWTVNVHDVIAIGSLLMTGRYLVDRIISIAGPGVLPDRGGYFKGRAGMSIDSLISDRILKSEVRLISGDPLMGNMVDKGDFLGFHHYALSVIPENEEREFLHFFRLGMEKYTFSKTYLTKYLGDQEYNFTTRLHGELRAFIDPTLYDQVMPLPISTMHLVKAVMAQDFDLAEELGLLGVDSEDFALPTFVCPSKIEMTEIIKEGLKQYLSNAH